MFESGQVQYEFNRSKRPLESRLKVACTGNNHKLCGCPFRLGSLPN